MHSDWPFTSNIVTLSLNDIILVSQFKTLLSMATIRPAHSVNSQPFSSATAKFFTSPIYRMTLYRSNERMKSYLNEIRKGHEITERLRKK